MSAIIIALFVLATFNASAQDMHFDDYRKFLMNGSGTNNGAKKMAIQTTCTTSTGQITRVGETAYDLCLTQVRNQADQKILTGQKDTSNPAVPSVGTTIHIGN